MLVLAEVKLDNCSFIEEKPTLTIEEVELSELGNSYVMINKEVFLKTILPISQHSLKFKIECLERDKSFAEKDIDRIKKNIISLENDVKAGIAEQGWVNPHLDDYNSRLNVAEDWLAEVEEKLIMYKKYIITKD